jgi:dihydrofolate reductase
MILSLIAAMDRNRLIGRDNALPWRLPADLQHFKRVTMGKPVLMGRRTYESIGKPLPGRENIVVTRNADFMAPGCKVVYSIEEALEYASQYDEVMVIGGADFYDQLLPRADRLYLTLIDEVFEGDAWFPPWEESKWQETSSEAHQSDERNPYPYRFVLLERVSHS